MYVTVACDYCNADVVKYSSHLKSTTYSFCDKDCHKKFKMTGITKPCGHCGKDVYRSISASKRSKSGDFFCNRTCATIVNNSRHRSNKDHPNYVGGRGSYRARALRHYGASCSSNSCPFDSVESKMLDVHHKDGNRNNNELPNLEVLCVWCHALETRMK